jgi:hypothetical protein
MVRAFRSDLFCATLFQLSNLFAFSNHVGLGGTDLSSIQLQENLLSGAVPVGLCDPQPERLIVDCDLECTCCTDDFCAVANPADGFEGRQ